MNNKLRLFIDKMKTPIDDLVLLVDEAGSLRVIEWADHEDRMRLLLSRRYRSSEITMEARQNPFGLTSALQAYFEGDVESLRSLPVVTTGTRFQQNVWQSLRLIPTGETTSYGALAKKLGIPAAVRAVGLAIGANPISIVVPCHRVIGSDGSLTGYAGGLPRKRWLLEHEQKYCSAAALARASGSKSSARTSARTRAENRTDRLS